MPQIIQLGWVPVQQDYETKPVIAQLRAVQKKLLANPEFLGHWEGVHGHGRLDATPIKGIDVASLWSSVEAAEAAKQSPEGIEAAALWPQIVQTQSHYGPVKPWWSIFSLEGDDFAKVASAPILLLSGMYLPPSTDTKAWYAEWQALTREYHTPENISSGFVAGVHGWAVEGQADHKGERNHVFMTVTGWESEETMKAAITGERRTKIDKGLERFGGQQHEHISHGLERLK